jgi:hypothetical protein
MVSAGLQMATGGWGNFGQQAAASLGAGASAASGTQQAQFDTQEKNAQQEAERQNKRDVASIGAQSRQEVASIRSQAMLERSRLTQGAKTPQEAKVASDAYQKSLATLRAAQIISGKTDEEIEATAEADSTKALAIHRAAQGGGKAPDTGAVGAVAPAPAAKPTSAAATKKQSDALWLKIQNNPDYAAAIATPEGRAKLKETYPEFKSQIDTASQASDRQIRANKSMEYFKSLFGAPGGGTP